jgi:hypothetical protein
VRPLKTPDYSLILYLPISARLSERFSPFRYALGEIRKAQDGVVGNEQNKKEQSRSSKRRGSPLLILLQQGSNPSPSFCHLF